MTLMLDENLMNANFSTSTSASLPESPTGYSGDPLEARLTDLDRRAVDFLLGGDSSASQEMTAPIARNSFMERVNSVRRLLNALDLIPDTEPSPSLVERTLRATSAAPQAIQQPVTE